MKRIIITFVALVTMVAIFMLCGCEATISKKQQDTTKSPETTFEPATAIVKVTDVEGNVLATEAVTMSDKDKEQEKNFFNPVQQSGVSNQASSDRINQALQNQQSTSKPNGAPDINGETTDDLPQIQDDYAVLHSSQYMINFRIVDANGVAQSCKLAKNGKYTSVSMVYNDVPLSIILGANAWYLLSPLDKTYIEIPKSLIEQNAGDDEFTQMLMSDPFNFETSYTSKTQVTEEGITYDVYEYENGNKDYFIGKTIIKRTASDNSVMYYDSVSPIAPMSLFTPPSDYIKQVVTEDNASDIIESIDPEALSTTHNHEH